MLTDRQIIENIKIKCFTVKHTSEIQLTKCISQYHKGIVDALNKIIEEIKLLEKAKQLP